MTFDSIHSKVERIVRRSEVMAVVRALRSHCAPHIGETLDYFVEGTASDEHPGAGPRNKPYCFAVEQWHLDEAEQVLADAASGRADRR